MSEIDLIFRILRKRAYDTSDKKDKIYYLTKSDMKQAKTFDGDCVGGYTIREWPL